VIFPVSGGLPRLVASSLERLEIPHNDVLGHIVPGIFESAEWQAWIELQRAPRLNSFLRFSNALPDPTVVSPKISRQVFEKVLRESYKEVLLDDLELLREILLRRARTTISGGGPKLCALLCVFFLRAPLSRTFSEQNYAALAQSRLEATRARARQCRAMIVRRVLDAKFPRALFLRWLEEAAVASATSGQPLATIRMLACNCSRWWSRKIRNGRT